MFTRVVSSPSGINYFLGLSTFFEVILRALKSCATLITGLVLVLNYFYELPGLELKLQLSTNMS